MSDDLLFVHAHAEYYETIDRYDAGREYLECLQNIVPPAWRLQRESVWLYASHPGVHLPDQGFKIHVSSIPGQACALLSLIAGACVERGTIFKCAAGPGIFRLLNSKAYDRGASGKFMTIYPTGRRDFEDHIEQLYQLTSGGDWSGPYILSDRRYKDSRVIYYRYGGLTPQRELAVDGVHYPVIEDPGGLKVRDYRYPYFSMPSWVSDPFGGLQEVPLRPSRLVGDRFEVDTMRGISNKGGVYEATDTISGSRVILKEARPHVNTVIINDYVIDSTALLNREYAVLDRLKAVGCCPKPIAVFSDWEHRFLAEERLEAIPLREFIATDTNLVLPYIDGAGALDSFIPSFAQIARRLLDIVEEVHDRGIIIGDLSQGNVLVDPVGMDVRLIDLEGATTADDDPAWRRFSSGWYTPGYRRPGRATMDVEIEPIDDLYALAVVLLAMFFGGPAHLSIESEALPFLVAQLLSLGVPTGVADAILALSEGRASDARRALATL